MNMLNKYTNQSVYSVALFDYDTGKHVVTLDKLRESNIGIGMRSGFLYMKDALYNTQLLSYLGREEMSDYEKAILKNTNIRKTIKLGLSMRHRKFKAVAKSLWKDDHHRDYYEVILEIPHLEMGKQNVEFQGSDNKMSDFDLFLKIRSFNEDGDLVKIHIEQPKE